MKIENIIETVNNNFLDKENKNVIKKYRQECNSL